jgi:hypothetical protein
MRDGAHVLEPHRHTAFVTPDQKFERRRNLVIAIPTGFLAAVMVFVAMGCVTAAKDDLKWLLVLVLIFPLLIVLCRTSATHLNAAMHPTEEWVTPTSEPTDPPPPPSDGDPPGTS